jgi:hypothetical protein
MERFNCKTLNEIFNIEGLDYILVESTADLNNNTIASCRTKRTKIIEDFVNKKIEIMKITNLYDDVIYQKEKDSYIKNMNDWISKNIEDLIYQQTILIKHLSWRTRYINETERIASIEYKKIRENFIAFVEMLDENLGKTLYENKIKEPIKHNQPNNDRIIKREQKLKDALNKQKNFLKKDKKLISSVKSLKTAF